MNHRGHALGITQDAIRYALREWRTIEQLADTFDCSVGNVRGHLKRIAQLPPSVGRLERRAIPTDRRGRRPHAYRWVPHEPPPLTALHVSTTPDGRAAREREAVKALRFFNKPATARQVANLASMTYPDALGALERLATSGRIKLVERSKRSLYTIESAP